MKAFYDIDTPVTVRALKDHGRTDYIYKQHLPELDVYFSFTGGPIIDVLEMGTGDAICGSALLFGGSGKAP